MWQPIGTAPTDGRKVLVSDGEEVAIASWHRFGMTRPMGMGAGAWMPDGKTYDDNEWVDPSHWMPLPEPPQTEK